MRTKNHGNLCLSTSPTCYLSRNHIFVEGISINIIIHGPSINQLLPSLKLTYCLKKGRAQKEKILFQPSIFRASNCQFPVAGIFLRSLELAHGKTPMTSLPQKFLWRHFFTILPSLQETEKMLSTLLETPLVCLVGKGSYFDSN